MTKCQEVFFGIPEHFEKVTNVALLLNPSFAESRQPFAKCHSW
jgi:hypothetical protein